jgi:uncharacterized protein (TIGR02001 family)
MHGQRKWYVVLLLFASACRADGFGGDLGIASDEVFRGLTQSDNQASPQVDVHYSLSGWYAGVSALEVRRGPSESVGAGLIGYLGYQQRFGDDWSASVAARHYDYPGFQLRNYYDYEEGALTVSWRELIVASFMASPDVYFADFQGRSGRGPAYTYEIGTRYPLPQGFCANLGIGYYNLDRQIGSGYAYGSAGISKQWHSLNFDARYVATDETARRRFEVFAENRVVLSVLWLF